MKFPSTNVVWSYRKTVKPAKAKTHCNSCSGEEKRKRGRPSKRWRDKAEEDSNLLRIKNGQAVIRDRRESWKIVLVESFVDLQP
jgi:hypothetical protein